MTTIERPKGAMTSSALGSKRMFWLYAVITALSLIASILDRSWDWASCAVSDTHPCLNPA